MQTDEVRAREKVFNMRLSDDEWQRLEAVAADLGLNAASAIRFLVKRHFDALSPLKSRRASTAKKPKAKP